ncbi:MAG: hypothetical protein ACI83P_001929 [Janthinobacterium sp.]|jgi:hypothetical protein
MNAAPLYPALLGPIAVQIVPVSLRRIFHGFPGVTSSIVSGRSIHAGVHQRWQKFGQKNARW